MSPRIGTRLLSVLCGTRFVSMNMCVLLGRRGWTVCFLVVRVIKKLCVLVVQSVGVISVVFRLQVLVPIIVFACAFGVRLVSVC